MSATKLLIVAKEATGKTRLISTLEDALVASTDNKAFTGNVPHYRYSEYQGIEHFKKTLISKVTSYEEKYGKLPRNIVIDSVTHLANNMERWANSRFTGFNIWSNLGKEILDLNHFIETEIIPASMNVVLTSHCQLDSETGRYEIASPGQFGKNGSWLSVTDNSVFIEIKNNKRIVHMNSLKFPARTNIDVPESLPMEDYDINEHIRKLEEAVTNSSDFVL